jgi:predicted amidohydrolase
VSGAGHAVSAAAVARLRVACVQMNTRDDKAANLAAAAGLIERAAADGGARLIVLPETWNYKGTHQGILDAGEDIDGPSTTRLRELAALHGIFLLAGSFYELTGRPGRLFNTSVLFGPHGERLAVYRKIHLFDAVSGTVVHHESGTLDAGDELVVAAVDGIDAGLSICYDLRFPEMYLKLALSGARILLVPSAFTAYTGAAHWHVLLRARAVETGCFVVAPDQVGFHTSAKECYGHSLVVDPWGRVLAEVEDGTGYCVADLDLALVDEVRAALPTLRHRRPDVYGG